MTLITEDPGEYEFEILNEESDQIEVLRINVLEVMLYLETNPDVSKGTDGQVTALRECAKPTALVKRLTDHLLLAKFTTAALKLQQTGKELGFSLTLPASTASPSGQRESATPSMSPA